jgi:hypothetical protein
VARKTYAVVHDVPASWDAYRHLIAAVEGPPPGLLVHIAGPTEEGIRVIDLWESQLAWERFRDQRLTELLRATEPAQAITTTIRNLAVKHLFTSRACTPR